MIGAVDIIQWVMQWSLESSVQREFWSEERILHIKVFVCTIHGCDKVDEGSATSNVLDTAAGDTAEEDSAR